MVAQPRFMFSFASEIKSFHGGVDTCPGKLSNIGEDKKILSYHAVNSYMTVGQYPSGRSTNDPQFAKKDLQLQDMMKIRIRSVQHLHFWV